MRLFTAVALPDSLVDRALAIQQRLAGSLRSVKWVERENLHLTLRFIGEADAGLADQIAGALAGLPRRGPFPIDLEGAGAFPAQGGPRIVWLGVRRGASEMGALFSDIEHALRTIGVAAAERPFSAHVTLGRLRTAGRAGERRAIEACATERIGTFTCEGFRLYESRLASDGPVYRIVRDFRFV